MVGQDKLINKFNTFTINTLPHSILLVGDYGCGKHTFCKWLAEKFNLNIVNLSEISVANKSKITAETLELINSSNDLNLVIISEDLLMGNNANSLLKFIEEPHSNIFNVIISQTLSTIPEVISNRCQKFIFEPYTNDILKSFCNDELPYDMVMNIANTPGKIINIMSQNLVAMHELAYKIFDKISIANIANILTICKQIKFGDDSDGLFDCDTFFMLLAYCAKQNVINNNNNATKYYFITNNFINNLKIKNINKAQLFEHYLYELKLVK